MRIAHPTLVRTTFLTALCLAAASGHAQATSAPTNLNLNDAHLPVASGTTKQPAGTALDTAKVPDPVDRSAESSPLAAARRGSSLAVNTPVSMQLSQSLDSGSVRNGDTVRGTLSAPLKTTAGVLPAGTEVVGTVVSAAKAGTIGSAGTLSLQLVKVGGLAIVTDVLDFNGQEGHKDVADAAPQKGTEASVDGKTPLVFHVLDSGRVPGLVKGGSVDKANGGPTVGSGAGSGPVDKGPNTAPGVNQTPAPRMTTPKR